MAVSERGAGARGGRRSVQEQLRAEARVGAAAGANGGSEPVAEQEADDMEVGRALMATSSSL